MVDRGSDHDDPPVTVSVTGRVKPGRRAEYEEVLTGMIAAASRFPGHLGVNTFRPVDPETPEYRIVFKFNHESNLRRWMDSEERRRWLKRADELAEGPPRTQVVTGLETWFTLPRQQTITPPPPYKMALVTWLAIFPLITALFVLSEPILRQLPLVLRTAVLTAVTIPLMTWVVMPWMTRLFRRWLYPSERDGG